MGRYTKVIEEGTFEHRFYRSLGFPPLSDEDGSNLVLRITLGDMGLLDGFYMSLPGNVDNFSIEDVIRKYILCESEADRIELKWKLSRDTNPDLLDIYDDLLFLYEQAETGKVTLSYHINNGASNIQWTDLVGQHQCLCTPDSGKVPYRLLDLVLEVKDDLDPFLGLTEEQKDAMLKDFRCASILYLMDRLGYQPSYTERSADPEHLSVLLKYLASEDVGLIRIEGKYSITPRGYDLLNIIIDEAEFYIDNYDIFGDVYIRRFSEIIFNTGYGINLVVPVLKCDGIDPYRALFIIALYLGNMDYLVSDLSMLFAEDPFRELFHLIACSPTEEDIGTRLLYRIIREGRSKIEERQLREARLKHIESIEQRINDFGF